jgi:DNA-binding SARP family transcriptional activator
VADDRDVEGSDLTSEPAVPVATTDVAAIEGTRSELTELTDPIDQGDPAAAIVGDVGESTADNIAGPRHRGPSGPVEVGILGPLLVTGTQAPRSRPQINQLLVYLALHRRLVPSQRLWEAVWPDRPYVGHTLRNRMSDLRGFIGMKVTFHNRSWQLTDQVSCDWQRFQALAAGEADEQLAALALVRGRPFEDAGNDWIHLEGQHAEIEAAIVDLALLVGERALADGDYPTASTAATAGLLSCPYDERLYQLGMKAAAGRGATGEIRALRRQLEYTLDDELEPDDTMMAGTVQLYRELLDAERTPAPDPRP